VDTHTALSFFSEDSGKAARLYREFMGQEGISKKELAKTFDQRILGDDEFVEGFLGKGREMVLPRKRQQEFFLEEIAGGVRGSSRISEESCCGKEESPKRCRRGACLFDCEGIWIQGHRDSEIPGKRPGAVTKYLRHRDRLLREMDKVVSILKK